MPDQLTSAHIRVLELERDVWLLTLNMASTERRAEQRSIDTGHFERTMEDFYATVARLEAEVAVLSGRK